MSRKKKAAIIIAVCLISYSLIGFVAIPLILETVLPDKLSQMLNRPVSVENIRLNPFTLTAAIEGFDIKDKNTTDPFISFDTLFVNVQTMSLFKLGLVVKELRLENPKITITRLSDTKFNFSDLLIEKDSEESASIEEEPSGPFRFSISNIAIIDGKFSFLDELVGKNHILSPINFNLPLISNFVKNVDIYSEPMLAGKLNHAEISLDVDTKPFHDTLETIVNLSLTGIHIPYYFAYIPEDMISFEITDGRLDIESTITFLQKGDDSELELQGTLGLTNFQIIDSAGNKILSLPEVKIDVAPSYPLENQFNLASVKFDRPELSVIRSPDGVINLTALGPKPADTAENPETTEEEQEPEEEEAANPFRLSVNEFLLNAGRVLFTDYSVVPVSKAAEAKPVKTSLDNLIIKVSGFSNKPDETARFDIKALINQEAVISTNGQLVVTPLSVDTNFSLADLKIAWAQPYFPESFQLVITDGRFDTSGHAKCSMSTEGDMTAMVSGKAAVTEFASVDPFQGEAFAAWNVFSVDGINVSTHPLKINTEKILLKDFKNQFIIFSDGLSNLEKIFVKSPAEDVAEQKTPKPNTEDSQESAPVIPINIDEVLLENFDFQFIDRNIKPHFSTRLNFSELRVTGLTSENFKSAELNADGKIDEHAKIKIVGKINPLKEDLFLDVTYQLSNLELSSLSPYTGKYIGRTIEKGKLSMDVAYKIDKKEISAQNRMLLDQFTLGKSVDSPDATSLPVGIAIALLKDRNGQINIELPISGRTDDPDFGIGKPLLAALENLLVKAATSPFDLVGSIVGGGEELRYIEFEAGIAELDDDSAKKLDAIIKLMFERPALKLDISGYIDSKADKDALTDFMLDRKIKVQKLNKASAKDKEMKIDDIVLSDEEYQKFLKKVYVEEVLSAPDMKESGKSVKAEGITLAEMELRVRDKIIVTDGELRLLALKRAKQVKNYLLSDKSIMTDRVFLVEPETLYPPKTESFKPARVELNLR